MTKKLRLPRQPMPKPTRPHGDGRRPQEQPTPEELELERYMRQEDLRDLDNELDWSDDEC